MDRTRRLSNWLSTWVSEKESKEDHVVRLIDDIAEGLNNGKIPYVGLYDMVTGYGEPIAGKLKAVIVEAHKHI